MDAIKNKNLLALPILCLLFALNATAQPGGTTQSFHIYLSLAPEMEESFDFGPIDENTLSLACQFYYEIGKPSKVSRRISYEEATFAEPAQIHVWYRFELEQYDFLVLDSVSVSLQSDKNTYSTILMPNENCICDFTGEFQKQKPGKCKTKTRYHQDIPDPIKLSAAIADLINNHNSKEPTYPSSAQVLRVLNSENKIVYPLVIANGDTCEIAKGNGINANVLPFPWENQKISLMIYHPDYPSLKLDSVARNGGLYDYVHLLKEDEAYFLDGGKRLPLENGYKELAFWFDPAIDDQELNDIVNALTSEWHLELSKDWAKIFQEEIDSLGPEFVESKYGGFDIHLKRVLHFKWNKDQDFSHTYNIADEFPEIIEVQIPVSFHEYLVPRLTVHFKEGLSETEILHFEKDYFPPFERIDFDTYRPEVTLISRTYQFSDWIYVPNHLQEMIMNDPRVSYCGGSLYQHPIVD